MKRRIRVQAVAGSRPARAIPVLALIASVAVVGGCKPVASADGTSSQGSHSASGGGTGGGTSGGNGSGPVTTDGHAVSPLADTDGTKPGLAPIISAADRSAARDLINRLTTQAPAGMSGYTREQFGQAWTDGAVGDPFADNGCDTRDDVLARDGQNVQDEAKGKSAHCVVESMTLFNPYTGQNIQFTKKNATAVQIDHVLPLGYSWQMGSSRWTAARREQLANDPLELLAVDGPDNGAKGDSGPGAWMPPLKAVGCSYAVRFAQVAIKYQLPVASADKTAMLGQCA
ncbi:hypothetical protein ABIA35_001070 [Catenulispora sp. MAP12-49]|uniref:HNH endonuclease family protein n=1 Tax=Catenulispora sp. MAP12-49 TaxID=3156302 RepID=UPI003512E05B